jgi:glycosyltransferase involved in cell wall biosynthesis
MNAGPTVSVIIPTRNRPSLVVRAVDSVLSQSMGDLEVIVVLDGPDSDTVAALGRIRDPRLQVTPLARRVGIGGARNAGIREAAGRWIAFLDDDDEWLAGKLEIQTKAAEASKLAHPIITARVRTRDEAGEGAVWPRRLPKPGEPLSEYLFIRSGLFWGETLVHTSTLLVDAALARSVPFSEELPKHEDLDWLLRACTTPGAGLEFVVTPEPLAIWSIDEDRSRASMRPDWHASLGWARTRRDLMTSRAYAAFALTWIPADAERQSDLTALWRLPAEALRRGRPRPRDFILCLGILLVPRATRLRAARKSDTPEPAEKDRS